ncbi:MAG TPA: hypothetical protein VF168_12365 [Trueperaceae bacterium]
MDKAILLIRHLVEKTGTSAIQWEETESEGEFQASFSSAYSVRIETRESLSAEDTVDYVVSIFNADGKLVEELSDVDVASAYQRAYNASAFEGMRAMYEAARRQAMGVDEALDALISDLSKFENSKTSGPDTDVEFPPEEDLPF